MNRQHVLYFLLTLIFLVTGTVLFIQNTRGSNDGYLAILTSNTSAQKIVGRWKITNNNRRMNIPNSFFWLSMDHIEFRQNGTILGLMGDPVVGDALRVNAQATYSVINEHQIEFVGNCRRQEEPCIGVFTISWMGDQQVRIFSDEGNLELERIGPSSEEIPPRMTGPSASPTP